MTTAPPNCTRCPRLCASRRMVVNGVGPLPASIMVVALMPSRRDERHGYPLYEESWAGSRVRERLMPLAGINPEEVRYECVVRCKPPRWRGKDEPPTAGEVKKCSSFLLAAILEARPDTIITLGAPALRWFTKENSLSSAHGLPTSWIHPETGMEIAIVPMYDPNAATPGHPQLAKVMVADWKYLGEVLAGRGEEARGEYLEQRLATKWVREGPV